MLVPRVLPGEVQIVVRGEIDKIVGTHADDRIRDGDFAVPRVANFGPHARIVGGFYSWVIAGGASIRRAVTGPGAHAFAAAASLRVARKGSASPYESAVSWARIRSRERLGWGRRRFYATAQQLSRRCDRA